MTLLVMHSHKTHGILDSAKRLTGALLAYQLINTRLNRVKIGPLWHLWEAFEFYPYQDIGFIKTSEKRF